MTKPDATATTRNSIHAHPIHAALSCCLHVQDGRVLRHALLSLSLSLLAGMGTLALTLLAQLAVVDVCTDVVRGPCLAHPSPLYIPVNVFSVFAVFGGLVALACFIRALALIAEGLRARSQSHAIG